MLSLPQGLNNWGFTEIILSIFSVVEPAWNLLTAVNVSVASSEEVEKFISMGLDDMEETLSFPEEMWIYNMSY